MQPSLVADLVVLFDRAEDAFRQRLAAGLVPEDEWPLAYAEVLQEPLSARLGFHLCKARIVFCLMSIEAERLSGSDIRSRSEIYARQFISHFAASSEASGDTLILYHLDYCPFCLRVRKVIDQLGLQVELREISENDAWRAELVAARGRPTVPVLRIIESDGDERWMPESQDIIDYLRRTYGQQEAA
ncbi:MAG: glutaredoxin family protein [Geminicoccaceae bacterium]